MAAHLGAHETMEVHEILTSSINAINHFQLYRSFVKDQRLLQMLDRQLQFMTNEYNHMLQTLSQEGFGQAAPYRSESMGAPVYGLDNPAPQSPNVSMNQLDDWDVSSSMLSCHKNSAAKKMMAALECANPQLRRMMQQSSINCSEQAYEVWQYMNHMGYYQVPTMKEETTNTVLHSYRPAMNQAMNPAMMQGMNQAPATGMPNQYQQ
ncbi:spore coat protein [Paenibacillus sp. N4]|uniref:spore coat protein n=1 Tax=Paenibacillus vietnamensis TaxID=2590547 RepID=UPI001CD099CA|nr:spore coat protein [Paenibacillus vietnamensis]MCA0755453.1 spore coat protein [Paenibacillus vietnamensis]